MLYKDWYIRWCAYLTNEAVVIAVVDIDYAMKTEVDLRDVTLVGILIVCDDTW